MGNLRLFDMINVTMSWTSAAFMLLLIIVMLISKKSQFRRRYIHLYLGMMISVFLNSVFEGVTWITGKTLETMGIFAFSLILSHEFCVIALIFIYLYLLDFLDDHGLMHRVTKVERILPIAIYTVMGILWAVSLQTNFLFTYGLNEYRTNGNYDVLAIIIICTVLFESLLLLRLRDGLKPQELCIWLGFFIGGLVSFLLKWATGLCFTCLGFTMILYVTYMQSSLGKDELLEKQKAETIEAKSLSINYQIRPHFIYNCMSVIQILCKTDPELAANSISRFSKFLRQVTDSVDNHDLIPFESEMETVDSYLWLESLRFRKRLQVQENLEAKDFMLPALSIQPIVENAVKHGVLARREGGTIFIHSYEQENEFIIEIADDGVGFDTEAVRSDERRHVGLKNVDDRLRFMCDGYIEVHSKIDEGTQMLIHIPKNIYPA